MDKPTSEQLIELLGNKSEITIVSDIVYGLDFEYKELQQRIDKAIEFIENNKRWDTVFHGKDEDLEDYPDGMYESDVNKLLSTLKGSDKEC